MFIFPLLFYFVSADSSVLLLFQRLFFIYLFLLFYLLRICLQLLFAAVDRGALFFFFSLSLSSLSLFFTVPFQNVFSTEKTGLGSTSLHSIPFFFFQKRQVSAENFLFCFGIIILDVSLTTRFAKNFFHERKKPALYCSFEVSKMAGFR